MTMEIEDERTRQRCAEQGCVWLPSYGTGPEAHERCKWCGTIREKPPLSGRVWKGGREPESAIRAGEAVTPKGAIEQLGERLTTGRLRTVKELMDKVAATAKENETRRCAERVKETISAALDEHLGMLVANDILITGGLEVEG